MGLGDFLKKKENNVERLPDYLLNEITVRHMFEKGLHFFVTLPINVTVQTSGGQGVFLRIGMFSKAFYSPPEYETRFARIYTKVKWTSEKIIIEHALSNGEHIFVNLDDISETKMYSDGISIELFNGTQYIFAMTEDMLKQWEKLGFNRNYPIKVFHKLLTVDNIRELQKIDSEPEIKPEKKPPEHYSLEDSDVFAVSCPVCGMTILSDDIRCSHCRTFLTIQKYQDDIKKQKNQLKMKNGEYISETNVSGTKLSEEPIEIIKRSKELLDMGAITQEEFDEIKAKYIDKI